MTSNEQIIQEYKQYSKYRAIFFIALGAIYLLVSFLFRNDQVLIGATAILALIFLVAYFYSNKKKKTILNQVNEQDEKAVNKVNQYLLSKNNHDFVDLKIGYLIRKEKFKPICYILKDDTLTIYHLEITKSLIYRYGTSKLFTLDIRKSELDKVKVDVYKDVILEKTKTSTRDLLDSIYRQIKDEKIKDLFYDPAIFEQIKEKDKDFISANQAIYAANKHKLQVYQIDSDTKVYL